MCSSVEVSGVRVRARQSGATLGQRLAHRGAATKDVGVASMAPSVAALGSGMP